MKKFKRLIALVTVAMFILSFAAPVAAATTAEQDAFARLNALGVAYGDTTGNPMLEKTYTRAEAAAILVQASGMGAAINSAKGATKFKDVPATHWATGVINIAQGAGIIQGYTDGTFKPDKEVTYAEMSAMLVQVLNYGSKLQGVWPTNVIGKAAQLGILDGLTVTDYNAPAIRGQVFIATDNAMGVVPLEETKDGWVERTDKKTLMEARLSVTKRAEGIVINVPNVAGGDKKKMTIDPDTAKANDDFTVTLIDSLDPNVYFGLKVVAWEKDDKVFFVDVKTDAADTFADKVKEINGGTSALIPTGDFTIKLDGKDKVYTVVYTGSTLYRNYAAFGASNQLAVGDQVKVILDGTGKVKHLEAYRYAQGIVKSVNTTDEKIVLDQSTSLGTLELKNIAVTIVKDGKVIALSDVKEGNIVSFIKNNNVAYIYVSDKVVEGKVESVSWNSTYSNFKLKIDGKEYNTVPTVWKSTDAGKNYTPVTGSANMSEFNAFFTKTAKAKLNKDGNIVSLVVDSAAVANEIAVFVKEIKRDTSGIEANKTYIRVTKFDGTNVYYEVTSDTKLNDYKVNETNLKSSTPTITSTDGAATPTNWSVVAGEIVKITLDSNNKVSTIKEYGNDYQTDTNGVTIDKTNDTITLDVGTLKVTTDTKLLKVKSLLVSNDYDEVEASQWSAIEGMNNTQLAALNLAYVRDGGIVKYIVVRNDNSSIPNLGSSYNYGVVTGNGLDVDGDYTLFDVNGESKKYYGTRLAKGNLVEFKVNTDTPAKYTDDTVFTATYAKPNTVSEATYVWYKIKSIDKANNILEVYAAESVTETNLKTTVSYIFVGANTLYYNDDNAKITIDGLSKDDMIQVYDVLDKDGNSVIQGATADTIVDFVKISKP